MVTPVFYMYVGMRLDILHVVENRTKDHIQNMYLGKILKLVYEV